MGYDPRLQRGAHISGVFDETSSRVSVIESIATKDWHQTRHYQLWKFEKLFGSTLLTVACMLD